MKRTVLIFGLIAGIIVASMFMITMPMYTNGTLKIDSGEIIGYSTMVIALSMIFFGVKSFRDNKLHGVITFGKAFQVGILIALVAALSYAISWEFYFNLFYPNFANDYAILMINKAKAAGADPAALQSTMDKANQVKEIYKNPFLRFSFTLLEIFPVGLLITLISAALLRKRQILPA